MCVCVCVCVCVCALVKLLLLLQSNRSTLQYRTQKKSVVTKEQVRNDLAVIRLFHQSLVMLISRFILSFYALLQHLSML